MKRIRSLHAARFRMRVLRAEMRAALGNPNRMTVVAHKMRRLHRAIRELPEVKARASSDPRLHDLPQR